MESTGKPALRITITITSDGESVRTLDLGPGLHELGNSKSCAIPLLYPTVSRRHGTLSVPDVSSGATLAQYEDAGSLNGSALARAGIRRMLSAGERVALLEGDSLCLGPFRLKVTSTPLIAASEPDEHRRLIDYLLRHPEEAAPQPGETATAYEDRLRLWLESGGWERSLDPSRARSLARTAALELLGDGPLTEALSSLDTLEVLANGPGELFVERGAGLQRLEKKFHSSDTYMAWVRRLCEKSNARLDLLHPLGEGSLPDGSRLQAVLAPLTPQHAAVAIRRFPRTPPDERWAVESGWMEAAALEILKSAVTARKNILVSGGTSSGKTTLLGFLTRFVSPGERIVTAEDVMELRIAHDHALRLQARVANGDGAGGITIRDLVRASLRLRPDRIIVGECRGAEVLDMLQAMNTGHPGSLTTIHANSAKDALPRLELLALLADGALTLPAVQRWVRGAIQLVVQVDRDLGGARRVASILEISNDPHAPDNLLYQRGHS